MGINGKILVFVDLPGGELDETGRGLLSYGARLSGILDAPWGAAVAARPDSGQLAAFGAYGTPTITCLAGGRPCSIHRPCSEKAWPDWRWMSWRPLSSFPTMTWVRPWPRFLPMSFRQPS